MFDTDVHTLIKKRISCRSFKTEILPGHQAEIMQQTIKQLPEAPFKNSMKFHIESANENDTREIKKLGTYGTIQNPAAFILGACEDTREALVDFGYHAELLVLKNEELGLGSCWLGASFQKSRFAEKIKLSEKEIMPAVIALGIPQENPALMDRFIRWNAKSRKRKDWDQLFFLNHFSMPLSHRKANAFSEALEMLRLAPSASNKQPWRVIFEEDKNLYHFILMRVGHYHKAFSILRVPDLQKIDLGIGMAHFEASLNASDMPGKWIETSVDHLELPDKSEYIMSWKPNGSFNK